MVKINNNTDSNQEDNSDHLVKEEETQTTKRYQINPDELTFPPEGMKHGRVVEDDSNEKRSSNTQHSAVAATKQVTEQKKEEAPQDPRIIEYERLQRLKYDENVKFIHFPDDSAYRPITIEAIKMNDFENEDLRLNTRIMMNLALHDYVVFREISEDDNTEPIPHKVYFRRVKTNEFQDYVDIQTQVDDLVKRVGLIESTYPFTLELQDKLYETQKRLIKAARDRVKKGFEIFFKWTPEERKEIDRWYNEFDNNDVTFNVDTAFLRITKSPFLRRKSSPSS